VAIDTGSELLERQPFLDALRENLNARAHEHRGGAAPRSPTTTPARWRDGTFFARAPISHVVGGQETADPHGIAVVLHGH
jgi:hypothetical protein